MEFNPKASAAVAGMAASAAAVSADAAGEAARRAQANVQGLASEVLSAEDFNRLAEAAPCFVRAVAEGLGVSLGALRQLAGQGQLTSAVLAIGIRTSPMDDMLSKEHPGEAIVPKACATRISGAAGGGRGGIHPGDLLVSKDVAAAHMAALQPEALNPSPDALALLAELIAEMRALRQDHARMAQLLSRWDGDGMPRRLSHDEN